MFEIMERTFTEEQWDSIVTVENADNTECYPAELRICDEEHSCLDNGHPVIYCGLFDEDKNATDEEIEEYIKSLIISNSKCKTGMRGWI